MDLVTVTDHVPILGETVLGKSFYTIPGGKGANQAVAAARMGADTTLIGCVGNDSFGRDLVQHLKGQGINIANVEPVTHLSTGIATITLLNGDNSIIVIPGANHAVTPEIVASHEHIIAQSDLLLLQLEIPIESVEKAVEIAKKNHVKVILNPAPIQPLPKELLQRVDYLTPNEFEQELLLKDNDWTEDEREILIKKCITTKGAKGVHFYFNGEKEIPSFKVGVVDTTGAGDSFNGALAYSLCEGANLEEACHFANAVAALSITKLGAQSGMPTGDEVLKFLLKQTKEDTK